MVKSMAPVWVPKGKRLIERVVHLVFSGIAEWDEEEDKRRITAPATTVKRLAEDLRALADLLDREVANG